jgi:hypothetical protein
MGEVKMAIIDHYKRAFDVMLVATHFKRNTGRWRGYHANPSKSQSSPFEASDRWGKWHPFDALLAERRAIMAGERAALEAAAEKDAAWWREVGRG